MKTYKVTIHVGTTKWYDFESGKLHRRDGPAIEYADGTKCWYRDGRLHREDGPAVEHVGGSKYWYLNDRQLSEQEWKDQTQSKSIPSCDGKTVVIDGQQYRLTKT